MAEMGIGILGDPNTCFLRKFRWMINIPNVAGDERLSSANILPPSRSARPSLSFKEMEAQHLNETIYFPGKPDWKPINVTLYGIKKTPNPVFNWVKKIYDVNQGKYDYPIDNDFIIDKVYLVMLDGCGAVMETWVYEDCWLQKVDFGDLDMSDSQVVMLELTMRYARAYVQE
jgi:hypothetical protein